MLNDIVRDSRNYWNYFFKIRAISVDVNLKFIQNSKFSNVVWKINFVFKNRRSNERRETLVRNLYFLSNSFLEFKRKCEFIFLRRCFLISFSICDQFQLFHFELNFEFIFIDLFQFDALLSVLDFNSIANAKDNLRVLLYYVSIANNS